MLNEERQLELYNLPYEATNLDILTLVPSVEIEEIQMPMRSSQFNKGYCLLTFRSEREADHFISEIEGLSLFGRELKTKKKYFKFNSQKKRVENKSDFIFGQAQMQEVQIEGSLLKFATEFLDK